MSSGIEAKVSQGQLGTVADTRTPGDGRTITYTAPTGAHSDAVVAGDQLMLRVVRPVDVGTRGESRVLASVVAHLTSGGVVTGSLPASDERGEDRVLLIGGERVTLQVTAIPDDSFWAGVARGTNEVHVPLTHALAWINDAICAKAHQYPSTSRASMLLAVDAAHAGVLADPSLRDRYVEQFGDPSALFEFGGVWLVGPTENHCVRVGRSRW
jgi:hypothetical protein